MVFRHISRDLKDRCVFLRAQGYLSDDICEILGVSASSVQRWTRYARQYGSVIPPHNPAQGRPPILNGEVAQDLHALVIENPDIYLDEMLDWLVIAHDLGLSRSALAAHLRDVGLSRKRLRKVAAERDEERRTDWQATVQANLRADQVVALDETSKDDRTIYRHYGRAPRGQRATMRVPFKRGQRWSVVAGLSIEGYEAYRAVPGSVDAFEFLNFVIEDVVSTALCHTVTTTYTCSYRK